MNVILSGGDVGKTTFLEAIALLLSPSNSMVLAEADYWQRNADAGFTIRAAISLPASSDIGQQAKFAWPWQFSVLSFAATRGTLSPFRPLLSLRIASAFPDSVTLEGSFEPHGKACQTVRQGDFLHGINLLEPPVIPWRDRKRQEAPGG